MDLNSFKDCKFHGESLPSRSCEGVLGKVSLCSSPAFFLQLWVLISCNKDVELDGPLASVSIFFVGPFCVWWGLGQITIFSSQPPTDDQGVSVPDIQLQQPDFLLQLFLNCVGIFKPKNLFSFCNPMITLKQMAFL